MVSEWIDDAVREARLRLVAQDMASIKRRYTEAAAELNALKSLVDEWAAVSDDYWPGYDTPYGQTEPNPDNPED